MYIHDNDTIIALSTPNGIGAIGVIRLSGYDAIDIVDSIFKGKILNNQESHTMHFGRIVKDNHIIDEVVASIYKAPHSYTGENVVEISCHGSPYIIQEIILLCLSNGARTAKPGEFTLRAFMNGKMDLTQAEAVSDLIASTSQANHAIAMKQMKGGFSQEIKHLRQELIDFAALIELELDFGEEDVEFADRTRLIDLVNEILEEIQKLVTSFYLGNVIKNGVATVIAGRPNAGKSTLLNALLNEERAIVSEIEGTTRDTVEEILNINGIQFKLIDTAGIRDAHDKIEAIGVDRTFEKIRQASLLVYVMDISTTKPQNLWEELATVLQNNETRALVIANKIDLIPEVNLKHFYKEGLITSENLIPISAKDKLNIETLKENLYQNIADSEIDLNNVILNNTRHLEALSKASENLRAVVTGIKTGVSGDFIAMDIRAALHYLGEITGEISSEDLLESIFSRFCIGK